MWTSVTRVWIRGNEQSKHFGPSVGKGVFTEIQLPSLVFCTANSKVLLCFILCLHTSLGHPMWTSLHPRGKGLTGCLPGARHCSKHLLQMIPPIPSTPSTLGDSFNFMDKETKAWRGLGILPKVTEQVRLI